MSCFSFISHRTHECIGRPGVTVQCVCQVFEAFDDVRLKAFTQDTGIAVDLFVASSQSCVYRLLQDMTDVASSVRLLSQREKDFGLVTIPFARDPLAVITHQSTPVDALTTEQLQSLFQAMSPTGKR